MRKCKTQYCISALVALCLLYVGFSFIQLDVNAANWEEETRATFALLSALICVITLAIYLDL